MDTFLTVVITPFYLAWKAISFLIRGAWAIVRDIAKGVYGKFIGWISALIFIAFLGWFASHLTALFHS